MTTKQDLSTPIAASALGSLRSPTSWRPLPQLTPTRAADVLRRASVGDARDFFEYAADIEEKNLHYASVLQTRKLAVSGLEYNIVPADDSRVARKAADMVRYVIDDGIDDFNGLLNDLLDALSKGISVSEMLFDTSRNDNLWVPSTIIHRPARFFQYDRNTMSELRLYDGSYDGAAIEPNRVICHLPKIKTGIPILGGLARSAMWAWVYKTHAQDNWASFAEMFGKPMILGKYDAGAQANDLNTLKRAVTDFANDARAIVPKDMIIELIESGSKSASADLYERLATYMDMQVSKCVLGQTLTADSGGGSFAQGKVHNEVRFDLTKADAKALASTLNKQLIAPIVRLNLGVDTPMPKIEFDVIEPEDMTALADQLSKLVPLGLQVDQAWVRKKWGIPEPAQDATLLITSPTPAAPAPVATATQAQQTTPPPAPEGVNKEGVDGAIDQLSNAAKAPMNAMVEALGVMVAKAESIEQLQEMMLTAYEGLDNSELVKMMEAAFALAALKGMSDAKP